LETVPFHHKGGRKLVALKKPFLISPGVRIAAIIDLPAAASIDPMGKAAEKQLNHVG
jgi:hypothetical protein